MTFSETFHVLKMNQHRNLAVVHHGNVNAKGVLIVVVGGPQNRVGSHRQFVQLARTLNDNFAVFRFDVTGMGDSSGSFAGFKNLSDDINCVIEFARTIYPQAPLGLFGLCDGATAIVLQMRNSTFDFAILVNPWAQSEEQNNEVVLKHHYKKQMMSKQFWSRLFTGRVRLVQAGKDLIGGLLSKVKSRNEVSNVEADFIDAMGVGIRNFAKPMLIVLSENDLVAREFESKFSGVLKNLPTVTCLKPKGSDHTFSNAVVLKDVSAACQIWMLEQVACL